MKRLIIGITLSLVASTWFLASQEHIASKPYSMVQRAYGALTEAMDRLPAQAATLRLWLPITFSPVEGKNTVPPPSSPCPFRTAQRPSHGNLGIPPTGRKPQGFSFIADVTPRFQLDPGLKQPGVIPARPLLAGTFGETELETFLHHDFVTSASLLENRLWQNDIAEESPANCLRTRDL
ncbi:MAG: hypothetical protein LAO21_01205 [Acidobacteriia bacterium]|nr:hypothetical protein [Terriglobia bacterium]